MFNIKEYRQKRKIKHREEVKRSRIKLNLRFKVLSHYSPEVKCVKCGFNDIRALQLDHINGGGNKQRKAIKSSGESFYLWIIKNNFPPIFQVLCANCNFIKAHEQKEFVLIK